MTDAVSSAHRRPRKKPDDQATTQNTKSCSGVAAEVHMTDVVAPVLVPYARFLEVRARRLEIVTELALLDGPGATNTRASSGALADNGRQRDGEERVLAADPAGGVQHS
jgi:hypothetical protein